MDMHIWKSLLLNWIKECNFIGNISSLEDSDIEGFFAVYVRHGQVQLPSGQRTQSSSNIPKPLEQLHIFLQEYYPDFSPRLQDDGEQVVSADYIYVYTLLMHYACVQNPNEHFQNICTKLPESMQRGIAAFFQQTINRPKITRNILRQDIVNVQISLRNLIPTSFFPSPVSDSTPLGYSHQPIIYTCNHPDTPVPVDDSSKSCKIKKGSTPIDSEAIARTNSETVPRAQHEQITTLDSSLITAPPTPRSELLEQRNRELLGLRAQLETERYEKAVLEEQISENERKITWLTNENKDKINQLAKLTVSLQNNVSDEDSCIQNSMPNEFDIIRQRLLKEISNKDAVLAERVDQIQELQEAYHKVVNKLKTSEKQLVVCMERISDLELRIDKFKQSLVDKEDEIACLNRDKLELQQCLQETRDELHSGREVLNASADLLDTMESTSMNTTPDNLASIVIDKQLHEKKQENSDMRERLSTIAQENTFILGELLQLIKHHQLELPGVPENTPSHILKLIENGMKQMSTNSEEDKQRVMELHARCDTLTYQNLQYTKNIKRLENEIKNQIQKFEETKSDIESSKTILQQREKEYEEIKINYQELERKIKEQDDIGSELIQMRELNSCLQLRINLEEMNSKSQRQQLTDKHTVIRSLEEQLNVKMQELSDIRQQLQSFFAKISNEFSEETPMPGDNQFENMSNLFVSQLKTLRTQLEVSNTQILANEEKWDSKLKQLVTQLDASNKQLVAQDVAVGDLLHILNSYSYEEQLISANTYVDNGFLSNLEQLRSQLTQISLQHNQLKIKCNPCSKTKNMLSCLQKTLCTESDEKIVQIEKLHKQCDQVMDQLDKNAECQKVCSDLKNQKLHFSISQSEQNQVLLIKDELHENQLQELRKTNNQLEEELRCVNAKQKELDSELKGMVDKTNEQVKEKLDLEQELQTIQQELGKYKLEAVQIKGERRASFQENVDKIEQLQKQYDQIMCQLKEKNADCQKISQDLQTQKLLFSENQSELSEKLITKNKSHELQLQELRRANNQLEEELKWVNENQKELDIQLKAMVDKTNELVKEKLELEQERSKHKLQIIQFEHELRVVSQNNIDKIEQKRYDQILDQLREKNAECQKISRDLQSQKLLFRDSQSEFNKELIKTNKVLEIQLKELRETNNQLEEELKELRNTNNQLEEELKCVNEKQNQQDHEVKAMVNKINEQTREKLGLDQELEIIREHLKARTEENKQLYLEEAERLQKRSSMLQTTQEETAGQAQLLQTLNKSQQQLKDAQHLEQQQIKLQNVFVLEAKKNESSQEVHSLQNLLAERENELRKSKSQLETTTKRLEKMAVRLGEQQALLSKTQREMSLVKVGQEEKTEQLIVLQHEKEALQLKLRQTEERANRSEDKLTSLEKHRIVVVETEQIPIGDRMLKLEKSRDNAVKIIRELQQQVNETEQEKVHISLEIGALNAEVVQQKIRISELDTELKLANDALAKRCSAIQVAENNHNDKMDMYAPKDMQHQLKLSETHLTKALDDLNNTRIKNESLQFELDDKKQQLEREREISAKRETQYQRKLMLIKVELEECNADLSEMRNCRDELMDTMQKKKLQEVSDQVTQHHANAQQLELDCQILQAKYREAKEEIERCELKVKDQRLEMEGKLEKMKTKMRALYTAEVTRMKEKQDRDSANNKVEMEKLIAQNAKYGEHSRKLSSQIVRLNENILEEQKQRAILSTKLRHLQEAEQVTSAATLVSEDWQPFKRPNAPSANLGSNLAMEDEEGEVFNNTYLTDLKLGRVPEITAEELNYRNSLQPPHLKSAYAAQYDMGVQEDDFRDAPHNLDDSLSVLLTNTEDNIVGTRKKHVGTHYKRPGPPTPSKNGGRLSFGSSEPPREVLREYCDNSGTVKTPARFKLFSSRFSIGNSSGHNGGGHFLTRDENSPSKRRLSNIFKRK